MPRKTAASPAAAKGSARAKSPATKVAPGPRTKAGAAAVKASAKGGVKAAVKSAAKSAANSAAKSATKSATRGVASPSPGKSARKSAAPMPAVRDVVPAARPVLVRDSFTMPEQEYAVLAEVRQACLRAGIEVKKSELLRIGVALLGQLDLPTLKSVLAALPQLKTGRPPAQA